MVKKIDMSVLPNGMLIQVKRLDGLPNWMHNLYLMNGMWRQGLDAGGVAIRPALDHWHFIDGSMALPDGLVFQCRGMSIDTGEIDELEIGEVAVSDIRFGRTSNHLLIAVKILGAKAECGAQLGMGVVPL